MAAVGAEISTDLGDPTASNWFISAWVISITVAFMLAGANTDMLGRRWFLIVGQLICTIGHIVVGTAHANTQIIVGMAIAGFGAALCQMAAFALPELLPNKWRHIGVVLADMAVYLTIIIIPVTARFGYVRFALPFGKQSADIVTVRCKLARQLLLRRYYARDICRRSVLVLSSSGTSLGYPL